MTMTTMVIVVNKIQEEWQFDFALQRQDFLALKNAAANVNSQWNGIISCANVRPEKVQGLLNKISFRPTQPTKTEFQTALLWVFNVWYQREIAKGGKCAIIELPMILRTYTRGIPLQWNLNAECKNRTGALATISSQTQHHYLWQVRYQWRRWSSQQS